jgi:hypothetical protein
LPKKEERKFPLSISRGRTYRDTFEYVLPEGFVTESIPDDVLIENQFGRFEMRTSQQESNRLLVFREFQLKEGTWPAETYGEFRKFMNNLGSLSNSKAVITRSN